MPEGPEIKLVADKLAAVVVDKPLTKIWFAKESLQHYAKQLCDTKVIKVKTKGKALLTQFDCGLTIYSHNQLYGRWYFVSAGAQPRTNRQLRWLLQTKDHSALLYSASEIEVLDTKNLNQYPFLARAGMDILSDKPTIKQLSQYIEQTRFAGRMLGGLLLDQSFIAGSGNYLRTEILFAACLHPETKLADLNGHQRLRLAIQIDTMIKRAYKTGGITNDEKIVGGLKAQGWPFARYRHFVFNRNGEPCHLCASTIQKIDVAGRRLYLCPSCQKRPNKS